VSKPCTTPPPALDTPAALAARKLELFETRHAGPVEHAGPIIRAAELDAVSYALDNRAGLAVVKVAAGAGKTWQALIIAAELAARGFLVLFLLPTVDGAREKARELEDLIADELAPRVDVATRVGMMRDDPDACRVYLEVDDDGRKVLETFGGAMGRRICDGCPYFEACPAADPPPPAPGAVTFAAHESLGKITEGIAPDQIVAFVDESPPMVSTPGVTDDELATLGQAGAAAKWRNDWPAAATAARTVWEALNGFAREKADAQRRAKRQREQIIELAALLKARPDLASHLAAFAAAPPPPPPPPDLARKGPGAWPHPEAHRAALAVLAGDPTAAVRVGVDGSWRIEWRWPWRPPEGIAVVVLDATPNLIKLPAAAKLAGRTVGVWCVTVEQAAPRLAWWVPIDGFRTEELAKPTRLLNAARNLLGYIRQALPVGRPRAAGERIEVGIITHKVLADALRGEGQGEEAATVRAMVLEWEAAGFHIEIGHFYADARETNRFERVEVLAVGGFPRKNIGAGEADAASLGIEGADVGAALAADDAGEAEQALARARWGRRGEAVALVWLGDTAPPWPGWTEKRHTGGGSPKLAERASPAPVSVEGKIARELAEAHGAVSAKGIEANAVALGVVVGKRPAERAAKDEAKQRGWPLIHLPNPRGCDLRIYAADEARASKLAEWMRTGEAPAPASPTPARREAVELARAHAAKLAREVAEAWGAVCTAAVLRHARESGAPVSDWAAWGATRDEARRREWGGWTFPSGPRGGRPPTIYAADEARADALWVRLSKLAG
jgi:hypothetical protein